MPLIGTCSAELNPGLRPPVPPGQRPRRPVPFPGLWDKSSVLNPTPHSAKSQTHIKLALMLMWRPPDEIFALILQYLREELASNFGPRFFQYLRRRSKFGNLASTQKSYLIGDLMSKSHLMRHDHDIAALLP
jgi:hypothetical protein